MTIEEKNYTIPKAITRIINERGMKQKAVAERSGMTEQQFTAIIKGRKLLNPVDIVAISKALDVQPNDLFSESTADTATESA